MKKDKETNNVLLQYLFLYSTIILCNIQEMHFNETYRREFEYRNII